MKKLLFLLLFGLLGYSILPQSKWEYPIKPGSEKWRSFTTHAEMVDACKIPEKTLEKMTTAELLEAWENFPLKFDVFAYNTIQKGFDVQKQICNSLKLLLTKKDVGDIVLKRYKEAKTAEKQIYEKQHPEISINDYFLLKLLLSQPEIVSTITDANAKDFIQKEFGSAKSLRKTESSLNIYTPRGTYVPNIVRSDGADDPYEPWIFAIEEADDYVRNTYPQATILSSSTRTYNCHSYAWANGYVNRCWINTPNDDLYFQESAGDGSYDYVSESVATKVSYSGDHSAITTGTTDVYISKWGSLALVQHNKNYCPPGYSSPSQFHRRSVDVPLDQPTITSALNAAVSGQTVHVSSGTYTENLSMKPYVGVTGSGIASTTINGTVNFNYANVASLSDVTVNGRISVSYSDNVSLSSLQAGNSDCYIDAAGSSWLDIIDIT